MGIPSFAYPFICHLICFHILAIVNAFMNVSVQICLWDSFNSFRYLHRSGVTGSMVTLFNCFEALQCCFHSSCTRVPIAQHPHLHWVVSGFRLWFYGSQSNGVQVIANCCTLHFSNDYWCWHLRVISCHLYIWRNSYPSPLPIFKLGCLGFCCWVRGIFCVFWILAPYHMYDLQMFSPILWVDFLPW